MINKYTTVEARDKFAEIVNKSFFGRELSIITRRGEALAAVVSINEYRQLLSESEGSGSSVKKLNKILKEI